MKTVSRVLALVLFVALAAPAHAQIMAMNGSWELNPGKSLGPSPVQETLVFTITPGLQRYTMTSVDVDGREGLNEWEIRLDDKTEFVVNKREGSVTSTYTRVLVDDDRTLISIGRDGEGQVLWVRVFEKVAP